jgi:hypothetical protein
MMRHWLLAYQQEAITLLGYYRTYGQLDYCRPLGMECGLAMLGSIVV